MVSKAAIDKWATDELGLPFNKPDGSGLNTAGSFDQDRDGVRTTKKGAVSTTVGEDEDDADPTKGAKK